MGKETPRDALYVAARLRLGLGPEAAQQRADEMLHLLQLHGAADTVLGVPGLFKGVSGGERRRVNIGTGLIGDPNILILDEPTTGLDSSSALHIGRILRDVAASGRTVVCTVHTPSSELFETFDDLLVLAAKGRVLYHGPAAEAAGYFAGLGCPVPPLTNPTEHFIALADGSASGHDSIGADAEEGANDHHDVSHQQLQEGFADAWAAYAGGSRAKANASLGPLPTASNEDDASPQQPSEAAVLRGLCAAQGSGIGTQLAVLTARSARMLRRDKPATVGHLVHTIMVSVMVGLFFFGLNRTEKGAGNIAGVLFMVAVNQVLLAVLPAVVMYPFERDVFLAEQTAGLYHPLAYVVGKVTVEAPFNVVFPTVYAAIVYHMVNLRAGAEHFFIFLLLVVLLSGTASAFGTLLSSLFRRLEVAMAFVPLLLMPLMIVAGLFANTDRLEPNFVWLTSISFPRYGFSGLIVNEFRGRSLCPSFTSVTGGNSTALASQCTFRSGDEFLAVMGFGDWEWRRSVWLFGIMLGGLWALTGVSLTVQGLARRGRAQFAKPLALRDPVVELLLVQPHSPVPAEPVPVNADEDADL